MNDVIKISIFMIFPLQMLSYACAPNLVKKWRNTVTITFTVNN